MLVLDSFQQYTSQSFDQMTSLTSHQDGHVDYMKSDDYCGEHHDKHVDCDYV